MIPRPQGGWLAGYSTLTWLPTHVTWRVIMWESIAELHTANLGWVDANCQSNLEDETGLVVGAYPWRSACVLVGKYRDSYMYWSVVPSLTMPVLGMGSHLGGSWWTCVTRLTCLSWSTLLCHGSYNLCWKLATGFYIFSSKSLHFNFLFSFSVL